MKELAKWAEEKVRKEREIEKLIELLSHSPSLDALYGYPSYVESAEWLIEQGVTVQEWIPVTERLPEKMGEHVLVCYSDGWVCDQYSPIDEGVTHWMPLPEPPKGE